MLLKGNVIWAMLAKNDIFQYPPLKKLRYYLTKKNMAEKKTFVATENCKLIVYLGNVCQERYLSVSASQKD